MVEGRVGLESDGMLEVVVSVELEEEESVFGPGPLLGLGVVAEFELLTSLDIMETDLFSLGLILQYFTESYN